MSDACDVLGDVVNASMQPAIRSIGLQKDALDKMSKVVPTITEGMNSYVQKRMAGRAAAMLSMAYVEESDIGLYRLRVWNKHGEASCEARLVYDGLEVQPGQTLGRSRTDPGQSPGRPRTVPGQTPDRPWRRL